MFSFYLLFRDSQAEEDCKLWHGSKSDYKMRLLNAKTRNLKEFMGDDNVPPYAILSHTWGDDEVTCQDINTWDSKWEKKEGYLKIKNCCEQAILDGLCWVWVDTCCIDKTSSAELSEAINSMFRWYEKAKVCYAYLSDVLGDVNLKEDTTEFAASRWFRRGWTLQELVAPKSVLFYSRREKAWHFLGTKEDLCDDISTITGIDTDTLYGASLELVSVARKMSWASRRETTRIEDTAYCLLGIFDVNMPLLYGEGPKAFLRLQEEILRSSYDYSLFAWGLDLNEIFDLEDLKAFESEKLKSLSRGHFVEEQRLRGLLASSPADFYGSHKVEPSQRADRIHTSQTPPMIHNRCVHIDFLIIDLQQKFKLSVAVLGYHNRLRSGSYLVLVFKSWGNGIYSGRMQQPILVPPSCVENGELPQDDPFRASMKRVRIKEEPHEENREGCFTIQDFSSRSSCQLGKVLCVAGARYDRRSRMLSPSPGKFGPQALFIFSISENGDRFGVVVAKGTGHSGSLAWACASKLPPRGTSFEDQILLTGANNLGPSVPHLNKSVASSSSPLTDIYTWPKTQSGMRELRVKVNNFVEVEVKLRPTRRGNAFTEDIFIFLHYTGISSASLWSQLSRPLD